MNEMLWRFWLRVEDEERFLRVLRRVVLGLWVAAILSGFFCAYRFGEYMQTRRMVGQNWRPVILTPTQVN